MISLNVCKYALQSDKKVDWMAATTFCPLTQTNSSSSETNTLISVLSIKWSRLCFNGNAFSTWMHKSNFCREFKDVSPVWRQSCKGTVAHISKANTFKRLTTLNYVVNSWVCSHEKSHNKIQGVWQLRECFCTWHRTCSASQAGRKVELCIFLELFTLI